MDLEKLVQDRVHDYYWVQDINCAATTLKILAELQGIELSAQVIDASTGMYGAGGTGAQCGLVEGALMFLGIWGKHKGYSNSEIGACCRDFALAFQPEFGSLDCRVLRPEGFKPENPPHLCEGLSGRTVLFTARFIAAID